MDAEFSAEQDQLRDSVRRFLAELAPVDPYVRSMLDGDGGTTTDVWRGLAQLGLTGLLVPSSLGGSGADMVTMGVVLEELGRAVHPGPFLASCVSAVTAIDAVGSVEDRHRLLPGLARGETVATLAVDEPDRRGDVTRPATTATSTPHGWLLDGAKTWVMDGARADLLVVPAGTPDGLALFVVERDATSVTATPTVDGTRKTATVELTGSPATRLGGLDTDAAGGLARTIDCTVVALVVDGLGAAEWALEMAVDYAKQRHQFGVPIGSFQAVQHLCADMLRDVELGRAAAYYALWACDHAEPAERHRAATMAKAFASDAFPRVAATAIQVFGGVGFTWENDVHLAYKRLLSMQAAFGDANVHLEELARIVLED